jgi:hypothetical protein
MHFLNTSCSKFISTTPVIKKSLMDQTFILHFASGI